MEHIQTDNKNVGELQCMKSYTFGGELRTATLLEKLWQHRLIIRDSISYGSVSNRMVYNERLDSIALLVQQWFKWDA